MAHIRNTMGYTFDDVLLIPRASSIMPADVDLTTYLTPSIVLKSPLLSAAMDTVTESALAVAMAQEGGMGFIHKNMPVAEQANEVRMVKKFENGIIHNPVTIAPNKTVGELLELVRAHQISGVPVVDGQDLVGIITNRDIRFEQNLDQPVANLMTPKSKLVTVREGETHEGILALLHENRIEKLLVINDAFHLKGMLTVKDITKAARKPNASKDHLGRLVVGAAVGVGKSGLERTAAMVQAEVDVVLVDTAHGHHHSVLEQVSAIKAAYPNLPVIAGNIATGEAALALVKAGADSVKVGMGPGSICTTRIIAGIGMPQISAIMDVEKALGTKDVPIIADGGIRYSGDVAKALAAGASTVMMGSLFAGTTESPGDVVLYQGRSYKTYRGMGSMGAMTSQHGSSDRYFQSFQDQGKKLVPEGIEGRVPHRGSLNAICDLITGGVRASMGYTGCIDLPTLHKHAEFVQITSAGNRESHVHDVTITREAANYQIDQS